MKKLKPPMPPSVSVALEPKKIILRNGQSPGDLVMMAYAVKALHEQHPGRYVTDVRCPCMEIFEGNPLITPLNEEDSSVRVLEMGYPTIHQSNQRPVHFVNSFIDHLSTQLNIKLGPTDWSGAIHIRDEEKGWYSAVYQEIGKDVPYWVIDAGHKLDFTAKAWDYNRWQEVVERNPDVTFVQVGLKHHYHYHPELKGKNLINLLGKTDLRQLIRLVYNAFGVLTPVSFPMVLAYAIEPHHRFKRKSRACVVIAGAREPNHWQAAANHQYIHRCGMLSCADLGGCWKSRTIPVGDGDNKDQDLCLKPVKMPSGQVIPKCMDMISVDEVCNSIRMYMDNLNND